ncbi:hypothetical protein EDD68_12410 [Melghiribacillus thermohalophilus]|uniref:Calcineurin-like phosphoesterase domain-containing protein n=1 Tax=Melghiribacillus thermohalophilus TaxID=1324956 RepID=A0A4R3MUT2_9BACI|nr:metallophosphoesterase [Melghiribacillus thermohalophilus]TCT18058.1 hypothetical protein EDD68_12410 [Melghiribacillus thermohalophilus]
MSKPINRRSFLKRTFYTITGIIGLSGGTYYYAKHIEPFLLTVKTDQIFSEKIPAPFEGFKILQFSDTHLGFHYQLNEFQKLVNQINDQRPDLVVFTGDLIDAPNQYDKQNLQRCAALLNQIKAPFGKYWIYGNHDHGGYGTEIVRQVMELGGFRLLQNETVMVEKDQEHIVLAGLDDVMLGRPDLDQTFDNITDDLFSILLCHEPDFADRSQYYPVDVQLSGHSHGGQIQLPFFGYIVTPPYGEKYVEGKYQIGEKPLQLFVTRGIGTTRLPYRFLCKPEIHLYTLKQLV